MSAQPGSATGTTTPFATVNVSPFLWYVVPYVRARHEGTRGRGTTTRDATSSSCAVCDDTRMRRG